MHKSVKKFIYTYKHIYIHISIKRYEEKNTIGNITKLLNNRTKMYTITIQIQNLMQNKFNRKGRNKCTHRQRVKIQIKEKENRHISTNKVNKIHT